MKALAAVAVLGTLASTGLQAGTLTVAVAANFIGTAEQLARRFETDTGHVVRLASGPTGKFYAQIVHGAPFDLFLAADGRSTRRLEEAGLILRGSRFVYARGQLALYSPTLPVADAPINVLRGGGYRRLALANPKVAPYGVAAEEALDHLGLLDVLRPRVVRGENIAQTYQFVATGNAELGFVALSQLLDPRRPSSGRFWIVPQDHYTALDQEAVVLRRTAEPAAAAAFAAFLRSAEARGIIEAAGYALP